jgi:hypothetical protein
MKSERHDGANSRNLCANAITPSDCLERSLWPGKACLDLMHIGVAFGRLTPTTLLLHQDESVFLLA